VTFAEMAQLLFPRSNFGMKLGLERMRAALEALGNPQRCAPSLHVAGTNGKGSTCAFAEAALASAGLRVGLYTSPHLRHLCERIRVGGAQLPEEEAAALFEELIARVPWALDDDGLTFFELATALAFLAFARARLDALVIEVGLGGRLDATNVLEPLACAVTPLGLEHTQYLGPTLAEIAREKAGIFKRSAIAVSAPQAPEAARVLESEAAAAGAPLWLPGRDYRFDNGVDSGFDNQSAGAPARPFSYAGPSWRVQAEPVLAGLHQRENAAVACALLEAAAQRGLGVTAAHAALGLEHARWPGRLQQVGERPLTLLDGAHNPHAARALALALPPLLAGRPLQLVFGALADKDAGGMLTALAPLAAGVHLCAAASPRAQPPAQLEALARMANPSARVVVYPGTRSAGAALEAARSAAGEAGAVLCCGSLYLVGELLGHLQNESLPAMPGEKL
jgi:dihydrofolate synthase/folylpolyglutamate synthase